jgi:hypothetical protein
MTPTQIVFALAVAVVGSSAAATAYTLHVVAPAAVCPVPAQDDGFQKFLKGPTPPITGGQTLQFK